MNVGISVESKAMNGKTTLLLLVALGALSARADAMKSVAVSDTPTLVFTVSISNVATKSLKVINRSSATIYCSPSSDVTASTGDPVTAGAWASYPGVPVWCIATVAQAGTGTDRTLVWESDQ